MNNKVKEEKIEFLKSDNICRGEKIPLPDGTIGVIQKESEVSNASKNQKTCDKQFQRH